MPVKIRLTRHGKKRKPYYHIVIADGRAPRDGRFIERIGVYNPNTNPATIEINFDKALDWLQKGAQPTETCRAILSYKGVLYKKHLIGGVKKGAFSEEEAEKRFQTWLKEKETKILAKKEGFNKILEDTSRKLLEAEAKVNEARALEIAKRNSELAEETAVEAEKADDSSEPGIEPVEDTNATSSEVNEEKPAEVAPESAPEVTKEPESKEKENTRKD